MGIIEPSAQGASLSSPAGIVHVQHALITLVTIVRPISGECGWRSSSLSAGIIFPSITRWNPARSLQHAFITLSRLFSDPHFQVGVGGALLLFLRSNASMVMSNLEVDVVDEQSWAVV